MHAAVVWVVSGVGAAAALLWIAQAISILRNRRPRHWLADCPAEIAGGGFPGLTVIVAARDEAAGIERAMRTLLSQDYPALQVIAVDDRSTDQTGPILDGLAGEDCRLQVVHIHELPPGWLGKTHALHAAASTVRSPWTLLTDADVMFAPDALRRAVAWAENERADHLTVVPQFITESVAERIFLMLFSLAFVSRVLGGRVESPRGRTHLGIGAFNLVRTTALSGIDGFDHLRLSVDDDNRLAQALKAAGLRGRAVLGAGVVSIRWQVGLMGLIRGLDKNSFSFFDFRVGLAALAGFAWLGFGVAPFAGLLVGPWWTRAICLSGIVAIATIVNVPRRQTGTAWYYAVAFPLSVAMMVVVMVRSIWLTFRRGGVRWRASFYPLAELRDHIRHRNHWLREMRLRK